MNDEWSQVAANAVAHEARLAGFSIQEIAARYGDPSAIYRPALSIDGDQWCALYGENLQDGVAGFGASPAEAMSAFDVAWNTRLQAAPKVGA